MKYNPAIIVVAYNRSDSLKRLLHSIESAYYKDNDITLIISIDYCDTNQDVIETAHQFEWTYGKKIIKLHEKNIGLKNHIFECGDYSETYGSIILLEDDLIVAPDFYNYVAAAHEMYAENEKIAGVALYSHEWNGYAYKEYKPINTGYDTYFGQFSVTWGQSWTDKQWNQFKEWVEVDRLVKENYKIPMQIWDWKESWGKLFVYFIQDKDKYYIMPYVAMSTCFSEVGEHTNIKDTRNQVNLNMGQTQYMFPKFEEGVHYDIFFENLDLIPKLQRKEDSKVCIDLFGEQKKFYEKYDYVLSSLKIENAIVKSYALEMRPHDLNVLYNITGNEIFLYDMKESKVDKAFINRKDSNLYYELYGRKWNTCLMFGMKEFVRLSINKIKKIIGIIS